MNPKVNFFFDKAVKFRKELELLRSIILDTGLAENLKWGVPCYTLGKSNVVLIHSFKDYCAILFFKGALIADDHGLLIQQTENVQAARQMRFVSATQILEQKPIILSYIEAAVQLEKSGAKVELKETREFPMAEEFKHKLDAIPALKKAFDALTPGRQRGYLLHFSQPKQSKTREARVEKYIPLILDGKGLNDE